MRNVLYLLIVFAFVFTNCTDKEPAPQAPICKITNPVNEEEIHQDTTIRISIHAEDPDGYIRKVHLTVAGESKGYLDSTPYSYDWNINNLDAGEYQIRVLARDNSGLTTEDEITVKHTGILPIASFSASQTIVTPGYAVQFIDQSSSYTTSWDWDFGDGSLSKSQNPLHIYKKLGTYTVTLRVSNYYGSDEEIKTNYITMAVNPKDTGSVTDYDGNTYRAVRIGDQWWMAENLKTTHFADGTIIQKPVYDDWENMAVTDMIMCYNTNFVIHNANYEGKIYGGLYNWGAAMKIADSTNLYKINVQGVCPDGWHLPSDDEWKQLEMNLGMSQADANNTRSRGTNQGSKLAWDYHLWGGDEIIEEDSTFGRSCFMALPGGLRTFYGYQTTASVVAFFWSSTEIDANTAWNRHLFCNSTTVYRDTANKKSGLSVRCIKD